LPAASQSRAVARIGRALEGGRLAAAFLALSLATLAILVVAELAGLDGLCVTRTDEAVFASLAAASALGLAAAFLLRSRKSLRWAIAAEFALCLAFIIYFPVTPISWLFLIVSSVLPASLYLAFPRNAAVSLSLAAAAIALRFAAFPPESLGQRAASFRDVLLFVLAPAAAAALASALSALKAEADRLSEALMGVTRLNLSYQDYSASVEERSALEERLRLTRDIHDVVGYALTNTMMLMRAASIMIGKEPEKVPALIETTQKGAESALAQVREILGDLRRREIRYAAGPNAIAKVVRVFRTATGADVDLDFGNFDWAIGDEAAFAAHHFVQEAMLNAFSHGKATSIRVSFKRGEDGLAVTVRDNGAGAKSVSEGIGISGMRERLAKVGGGLEYSSTADGFSITMRLPLAGREDRREARG
jgi:signal transduction histidine kinase